MTDNSSSLISCLETAAANQVTQELTAAIAEYGVTARQLRRAGRTEDSVYGQLSGVQNKAKLNDLGLQKILITGAQWRIISGVDVGYLEDTGYMYCLFDIQNGDVLEIQRSDNEDLSVTVSQTGSVGLTSNIVKRFTVSNLGGD